jgi:Ca2+-binding RTX toxin-like protein
MGQNSFVEGLEPRQLFAATAALSKGVLRITGTESGDKVIVRNHAPLDMMIDVILNGVTTPFTRASINSIIVKGLGGRDTLDLRDVALTSKIYGGDGNDTIYGSATVDRIYGGAGDDYIVGGAGNDILRGEAGADRIFGGDGRDNLYAGPGKDALRGQGGVDRIYATIGVDDLKNNKEDIVTHIVE